MLLALIVGWRTHEVTIRYLDLSALRGVSLLKFNGANRITVQSCRLHDSHWGIRLYGGGEGHRLLNTEVFNIRDDRM